MAGASLKNLFLRKRKYFKKNVDPIDDPGEKILRTSGVTTYPEMTKNMSTPRKPAEKNFG
jgi:hypothetical protein